MTAGKPDLVMLTGRFPYGEAVLRGELAVTAESFDRVFIVPSRPGGDAVDIPDNAVVVDLSWKAGWSRREKLDVLRSRLAARIVGRTLRRPSNWRAYAIGARAYLDILAENLLKARSLEVWVAENGLGNALFYDFWFENSTLSLAALRQQGAIRCAVARAHRFDAFDFEDAVLRRVPFREFKADHLDAIFPIAEESAAYMRDRIGGNAAKVRLARLGVTFPPSYPEAPSDPPLVVSCSTLIPRKRVHLIPEVLRAYGRPLRWVHFGDGPERGRVEAVTGSLPESVAWELRGWVDNAEIADFYARHRVSAFLSLSESEGIPVSMMEAQSYGVPIVALGVGGIPEIVQAGTGVLLPPDSSLAMIAKALAGALGPGHFEADHIRSLFGSRFDASANYKEFADALVELWLKNAVPIS
jgi:glycosyltransferase involved in cell wall biosynthesis